MSDIEIESNPLPAREVIEYLEIPLRRPWLTVVPLVVGSLLAVFLFVTSPKWYQSSTLILVESEAVPEMLTNTPMERSGVALRLIKQEMLSRTRLERVVRELEPYPEYSGKRGTGEIVEFMRGLIEIRVKGDDAFVISFAHKNPYLAMAVTNRLVTLFIEEASQARRQRISEATKFIDVQLEEARAALSTKEKQVRALKAKFAGSLPGELATNLATLTRLQADRQSILSNIAAVEVRALDLEKSLNEERSRAMPVVTHAATVLPARQQLEAARQQLADIRARYTDQHPEVKRLASRVERLQEQLEAEAAEAALAPARPTPVAIENPVVTSLETQLRDARREAASLRQRAMEVDVKVEDYDKRVAMTPQAEEAMTELTRDYSKLLDNYQSFLKRSLEAEMTANLDKQWQGSRYKMIDPPFLPEKPFSPKMSSKLGIGVGLGLLIGLGAAVAAELLDHSVKNARELEVVLPHPLLVTVPHMTRRRLRHRFAAEEAVRG